MESNIFLTLFSNHGLKVIQGDIDLFTLGSYNPMPLSTF